MKLQNIKCYEKKEFNFGDTGTILISGPSGRGKSSIFHAIEFCLYGKSPKIMTVGKKSCLVTLEFGEFVITRKKGPNRLLITDKKLEKEFLNYYRHLLVADVRRKEPAKPNRA